MIWCVDDDRTIRDLEVYTLEQCGFSAKGFADGKSVLKALEKERPELILLDIMLPEKNGVEILKEIRNNPKTKKIPVIMATAKGTEMDKILGLDAGADDYLAKPFGLMEMVSRVKAVLRRCEPEETESEDRVYLFKNILLNDTEHVVTVSSVPLSLTAKEFKLLKLFLQHPGKVLSRDRILSEVWDTDYLGESRTVDMHIKTLRKKLGESGNLIETVIGVGYRLGGGHHDQ